MGGRSGAPPATEAKSPAAAASRSARRQRLTTLALQGAALVLYGLHVYVYRLPPSPPDTVPPQASVETAWWGLWPVQYAAPWFVLLGGAAVVALIAASWLPFFGPSRPSSRPPREPPGQPPAAWGGATQAAQSQAAQSQAAQSQAAQPQAAQSQAAQSQAAQPQAAQPQAAQSHPIAPAGAGRLLLPLLTAALFAAFYLFPLAHTRWGDAFMLANGIAFPDAALRLTHSWQAPLDVFLHSEAWRLLHGPLGWEDAAPAYRLLSPWAGLLYLLGALGLSSLLARTHGTPPWLTYGLLATLGIMQLFFGYVENYAFAAAGVLVYLWLGLRVLEGQSPLWLAAVVLALTNATHPSTVILAPSLLFLGWRLWREGNKTLGRSVLEIALPVLLIGGATFAWMEASGHGLYALLNTDRPGGGDARWFVPLTATSTRWERYTMFSWPHLRDWLNQQLLVAPAVLPALAIAAVSLWGARREAHEGEHADPQGRGPQTQGDGPGAYELGAELRQERGLQASGSQASGSQASGLQASGLQVSESQVSESQASGLQARGLQASGLQASGLQVSESQASGSQAGGAQMSGAQMSGPRGVGGAGVEWFLAVAAGFYLLFTWVWNPDYGGQRDWDLFSLAALPPAVLLAVLLPQALPQREYLRAGALPLLLLQGWHTALWIFQNTLPWEWPD